jgi:hypothetical protein
MHQPCSLKGGINQDKHIRAASDDWYRTLASASQIVRRCRVVSITHGKLRAAGEGKPPGFPEVSPSGADDAQPIPAASPSESTEPIS